MSDNNNDVLATFVQENYCKTVKMSLASWLLRNHLPVICENKYDGIRVFLFKSGDKLLISSKNGGLYTPKGNPKVFSRMPEFLHAPHRMILDGEYVSKDASLHFFDVLQVDDRNLRPLLLEKRKQVLHEILQGREAESPLSYASSVAEIEAAKEKAIAQGLEGIIVKNPLSSYGQANSWLKLKKYDTVDCFVVDYEETPELLRSGVPRSWQVAVYNERKELVDLGKVGAFVEKVDPREVRIGSVIEVRYQEFTRDGKLRAPFILRVRHDKTARECLLSQLS